jgi:hypothetical protein
MLVTKIIYCQIFLIHHSKIYQPQNVCQIGKRKNVG